MSTYVEQDIYFPSNGTPSSPPSFDTYWNVTGSALQLPAVWNVPSGSADAQTVISGSTPTYPANDHILFAQFVLPAFGVTVGSGANWPTEFSTSLGGGGLVYGSVTSTKTMGGSSNVIVISPVLIARVFNNSGAFRFYSGVLPPSTGNANIAGGSLSGTLLGRQFTWNKGSAQPSNIPASTDILVVELGFVARVAASGYAYNYTTTWQLGDSHPHPVSFNNPPPGNSIARFYYWGTPPTPGGVEASGLFKPLVPTLAALHFQYPTVPDRTDDTLNALVLNV